MDLNDLFFFFFILFFYLKINLFKIFYFKIYCFKKKRLLKKGQSDSECKNVGVFRVFCFYILNVFLIFKPYQRQNF